MSSKIVHRITSTLLAALALSAAFPLAGQCEEYLNEGIKLFGKRDYANARRYFDKAVENAPWDSNAYYYQALTAQYCRDFATSKKLWAKIIDKFPGTPACANATQAMRSLDPGFFTRARSDSSSAGGSTSASATPAAGGGGGSAATSDDEGLLAKATFQGPAQDRIPVTRADVKVLIDVQVNGRSGKFEFQGSSSALSVKDVKAMQITKPDRTPYKAGDKAIVSVRMGQILASNFPMTVEDTDKSRIGDDFFRAYSYQLDPSYLVATKKQSSGGGKTAYDVPFRKSGSDMMVECMVNGRRVTMLFDPKGSETVVPAKRAREFGLNIEESSDYAHFDVNKGTGPLRGEAGFGETKTTATAEAKVNIGPVNNQVVQIKVDDKAKDAKIGSDAFGGWKFSVDPGASMIRFSR